MAELSDLITEIQEGNKKTQDALGFMGNDSKNSRRHLLEMKKSMFGLAENIARMADVPPPPPGPTEGEQTEQRREDRKFDELKLAELKKIAAGITGIKSTGGDGGSGGKPGKGLGALALAGGIGAFAGAALKGAAGLVAMGVAIPAFFGGLLAGDKALAFLDTIGADFNFTALKAAAIGFASIVTELPTSAMVALGGLMAVGAIGGTKAALGVGTLGAGIAAFLGGLVIGDALLGAGSNMGWLDLNFTSLAKAMTGFSSAILNLSTEAQVVLGTLLLSGAVAGLMSKKPTDIATGMTSVGAGIAGFFLGLAVGDAAMSWLGSDFQSIPKAIRGFDAAVNELSLESITALAAILGAGMVIGKLTDEKTKAKMVTGVGAITAGIVAFFGGFALMDMAAKKLGEGDSIRKLIGNFTASIKLFDKESMIVLGGLMGIGALFGAVPGGLAAATGASIGMGLIGAGVAAFFLAFDAMAGLGGIIGVDGESTKTLITNMSAGLKELTTLDGDTLLKLGEALPGIGGGIAAFFAADALGSISENVKKGFAWLFGESKDRKFEKIAESLKPLEDIKPDFTAGLGVILDDLERLGKIAIDSRLGNNLKSFSEKLLEAMPSLETALYGGIVGGNFAFSGTKVKGLANGGQEFQLAVDALSELQQAAAIGDVMRSGAASGGTVTIVNDNSTGGTNVSVGSASSANATNPADTIAQ